MAESRATQDRNDVASRRHGMRLRSDDRPSPPGGAGNAEDPGVSAGVRVAIPGVGARPPPGVIEAVPGVKP